MNPSFIVVQWIDIIISIYTIHFFNFYSENLMCNYIDVKFHMLTLLRTRYTLLTKWKVKIKKIHWSLLKRWDIRNLALQFIDFKTWFIYITNFELFHKKIMFHICVSEPLWWFFFHFRVCVLVNLFIFFATLGSNNVLPYESYI